MPSNVTNIAILQGRAKYSCMFELTLLVLRTTQAVDATVTSGGETTFDVDF